MSKRVADMTPEELERRRQADRKRRDNPEFRVKRAEYDQLRWADPEFRTKEVERKRRHWATNHELRARQAERKRHRWATDPEYRARRNDRRRAHRAIDPSYDRSFHKADRRAAVIARDAGVCQLCGRLVDLEAKWPVRSSAEIDHVVPVKFGGTNELDNLKLAHAKCNSDRRVAPWAIWMINATIANWPTDDESLAAEED